MSESVPSTQPVDEPESLKELEQAETILSKLKRKVDETHEELEVFLHSLDTKVSQQELEAVHPAKVARTEASSMPRCTFAIRHISDRQVTRILPQA